VTINNYLFVCFNLGLISNNNVSYLFYIFILFVLSFHIMGVLATFILMLKTTCLLMGYFVGISTFSRIVILSL